MYDFSKIMRVFLFAASCLAAETGDFAPLQVGNAWLYQGFKMRSSGNGQLAMSYSSESFRTIEIMAMEQVKDTLKYLVKSVDTNFNRFENGNPIRDTVITHDFLVRERLGVIQANPELDSTDKMCADLFRTHKYPDSLAKPRLIENMNRLVVAESVFIPGFRNYTLKKSEKIKEIGVHTWRGSFANTGSSFISLDSVTYSLIQFNNLQVHPVAAHPHTSGKKRRTTMKRSPSWILESKGVNALGRNLGNRLD